MWRVLAVFLLWSSLLLSQQTHEVRAAERAANSPQNDVGYCQSIDPRVGPVRTPLMLAIWRNDVDTVAKLVKAGADLNALYRANCHEDTAVEGPRITPLYQAIFSRHQSLIRGESPGGSQLLELLLKNGADPNLLHALIMAAQTEDVLAITALLQHKARIEDRDRGETALLAAAQTENGADVIKELARAGANLHAVNNFGDNAVALAAWQHQLTNVKVLIELGVNPCAKNKAGHTAVYQANFNLNDDPGKQAIIDLIKDKCNR